MTHWTQQQEEQRELRAQLAAALRTGEEVGRRNIDLQMRVNEQKDALRVADDTIRRLIDERDYLLVQLDAAFAYGGDE